MSCCSYHLPEHAHTCTHTSMWHVNMLILSEVHEPSHRCPIDGASQQVCSTSGRHQDRRLQYPSCQVPSKGQAKRILGFSPRSLDIPKICLQVDDDKASKAAEPPSDKWGGCDGMRKLQWVWIEEFLMFLIKMRLQATLLQTTWCQTEMDIESDLSTLQNWSSKFHLFASQQASPCISKTSK